MMRRRKRCICTLVLFLMLLGGCTPLPRMKTVLLPERENATEASANGTGEAYAVHKIYSREIKNGISWIPEIYPDQEHSFRYWSIKGEGETAVFMETALDYRYGFYEEREFPLEQETKEVWKLLRQTARREQGCDAVSPDGRYAVLADRTDSAAGAKLYLLNLENGDRVLLLDGGKMDCPEEEYRFVTGWSPDSRVLCYGFCPKELTEKGVAADTKAVLHFRQLQTGEQTSIRMLYWRDGMALGEIDHVWLYGDWKAGKARAALVYTLASEQQNGPQTLFHVQWIYVDESEKKKPERMGWPSLEIQTETACGSLPVYLDAEQDRIYLAQKGGISVYTGSGQDAGWLELPPETQVLQLQAVHEGNAVITIEMDENAAGKMEDICLYRRNGPGFTRSILYKGCGTVYSMRYETEHQRLVVSAGSGMEERGLPLHTWQGIVLEFD